ncbi:hypothetical protein HMI49_06935 [Corallococcus exercitus]|uniref:Uncharacterized protein n=1 Tax=Corallococcus exercitus TaxID=2316736 RepID=A0A7Y4NRG5_9BACT|nr:hypothetical protein [Corallococcus exercitus]NOK32932.1 hypothetical protein [Corallococcus exercitus]
MGLLNDVRSGAAGLRLTLPGHFTLQGDQETSAHLVDVERRAALFLFRSNLQIDLSPEHDELLALDIERHARDLFERHFHVHNRQQPAGGSGAKVPRTADPDWSPVVSIKRVRLGTCGALSVVHRMAYEPGMERVMGHLLIPLRSGLFEFRIVAVEQGPTGVRENVIFGEAAAKAGVKTDKELDQVLRSFNPDDPRHDSRFPQHPLSAVRSLLHLLAEPGNIQVTEPALQLHAGEVRIPDIGCAMTPPPRYLRTSDSNGTFLRFSRLAFAGGAAGSDGVQVLTISCFQADVTPEDPECMKKVTAQGASLLQGRSNGAASSQTETWMAPGPGGGVHLFFHTVFPSRAFGDPPKRAILRLFTHTRGVVNFVLLEAAACLSREEMLADIEAVIQSWRVLGAANAPASLSPPPAEKKKSWWQWSR